MTQPSADRPLVAVGVIILNAEGKVLLGERLGSHGAGTYQIPGGHMEFGKSFEDTARDEVREETGLTDLEFKGIVSLNNERVYGKHYVNLTFVVECKSGEPTNPEPEKSRNWQWYDKDALPSPIFAPSQASLDAWKSGIFLNEVSA
ncbi:MAG TPA: NUDIX domain-containing protein [Candidatus Paceibacterota bacterium]|nr:NUDIX domain-containing protein [Candidatus Paceibacterota bacterium]